MTDKTKPEALTDADLDDVQGGAAKQYVKQTDSKGVVLSSESHEPNKGIVLSSEGENPNKGIVLSSETQDPNVKL